MTFPFIYVPIRFLYCNIIYFSFVSVVMYTHTCQHAIYRQYVFFPFKGHITIPGGMTFTVNLNGANSQFTLTCISTGGPATTVIWTRDSAIAVGEDRTALVNAETAQYTHILTVTEKTEGVYRCNVSNSKPSSAAAELSLTGIAYFIRIMFALKYYLEILSQPPPLPLV